MTKKILHIILLLLITAYGSFATEIMPLDDIKPGMKGYGKTVFSGTKIESFDIEVVEIIYNFSPQMDLILIKLVGDRVEHSGVVSGMSGSPIYINDRLIGALSYSLMLFAKDPIAGVTPIEEMLKINDTELYREQELQYTKTDVNDFDYFSMVYNDLELKQRLMQLVHQRTNSIYSSATMKPLQIPLNISGMEQSVLSTAQPVFEEMGYILTQGGSAGSASAESDAMLQPGSAVSGVLLTGDMSVSATGTVTTVNDGSVLAFGHPFMNTGPVNIPMAQARILTILASQLSSTKLSSVGNIIGTIKQDRATGVLGKIGESIDMIPINISYESPIDETKYFHYDMVKDEALKDMAAILLPFVVWNSLQSARFSSGNYTLTLDGEIILNDSNNLKISNIYSTNSFSESDGGGKDIGKAVLDIFSSFTPLIMNEYKYPDIREIKLNYTAVPGKQSTTIDRIWYDKKSIVPGQDFTIFVKLRDFKGKTRTIKRVISIPQNLSSRVVMVSVGNGDYISKIERQMGSARFRTNGYDDILRILNQRRKNNALYVQVRSLEMGAIVEGEELQALPPSVLNLLADTQSGQASDKLYKKLLYEYQIPFDTEIFSGKTIRLPVRRHQTFMKMER